MEKKTDKGIGNKGVFNSIFNNDGLLKLMVAGIVVSLGLIFWGKGGAQEASIVKPVAQIQTEESNKIFALERSLEDKLSRNLSQMQGVGRVQVSVSLASGVKSDYAKNANVTNRTTVVTDKSGATQKSTEVSENDQLVLPNGATQPVVVMEESPEIDGVLVIAEGAKDPQIREAIHTAVRTLLNIPAAKITVVPMGGV